ncbi:MAG: tripartite tricarboxylate transporter permease [Candidatus Nanosalina sp.]
MILISLAAATGVLSGVVTGVIPGIHPNTVIFTSLPVYLESSISLPLYLSFLTGMSISHTFHDFLPAIFLSAPDADAALSAISAPEMLAEGRGLEAFRYTVYGGIISVIAAAAASAPLYFLLDEIYSLISPFMEYILLFFLFYLVLESEKLVSAAVITAFAGTLGIISFKAPVNQQFVLVPVFSGLFAVPAVFSMLGTDFQIPEQREPDVSFTSCFQGGLTGTLAGLMAGVFPGIGSAVSTSFLTPMMDRSRRNFLAAMGAVNTSDMIFSLLTLQLLGKARSGTSVALKALSMPTESQMLFLGVLTLVSTLVSAVFAARFSRIYGSSLRDVPLRPVFYGVLLIVASATVVLTGLTGLLVLAVSSLIGMAALESENRKVCMAVLIVPSILFFANIGIFM